MGEGIFKKMQFSVYFFHFLHDLLFDMKKIFDYALVDFHLCTIVLYFYF